MELWELTARESIRDLVARYNANGDAGRFAQVLELFADDAAMEIATPGGDVQRYEGHDAIATIFTGTKERWDSESAGSEAVASGAGVGGEPHQVHPRGTGAVPVTSGTSPRPTRSTSGTGPMPPVGATSPCSCRTDSTTGAATSTPTRSATAAGCSPCAVPCPTGPAIGSVTDMTPRRRPSTGPRRAGAGRRQSG